MTWSEAFTAYLRRHKIKAKDAAKLLDVSPSTVHYWTKGSEPRGESGNEIKQKVEIWSQGEVKAAPWVTPEESGTSLEQAKAS